MPYTTISSGGAIQASWANANVRDQVVTPFANAAARTSAVTAPIEGMLTWLSDTDSLEVYTGSAWLQVAGGAAGLSWSPSIVQGATPTLTVSRATYHRQGRRISGDAYVTLTGAGTAGNIVTITVPVAMATASANTIVGTGWIFDQSLGVFHYGILMRSSSTTVNFLIPAQASAATYLGTAGFTAAFAASDVVSIQFDYESAS